MNITAILITVQIALRSRTQSVRERLTEEHGEGVVSTAIAVLIVALLGAAMWVAFRQIFDGASARAGNAVNSIGG